MSDPREVTSEVPPNRALPPLLMEDLPPSLQSLINRHPPHAIQSADNTTWTVSEVSSPAEETTSAVSVECGTESVTESVAPATSVSNDLSTAEVESLVDSYIAGRTSDFWKDLTFGNDFQTDEPELESWDKRMEQLSYDKDRLEERLKKLRETILACGGTRDQLWRQCRSLRQTIKSLCEARYGIQSMGGRSCKKLDDGLTSGMIQVNGTGHPIYLDQNHATGIKPHQVRGVSFLFRQIVQEKLPSGALLAHEMGLGKTFQVVAFLSVLAAAGSCAEPLIFDQVPAPLRVLRTLVLCPAALADNWVEEFEKWRPKHNHLGRIRYLCACSVSNPEDRLLYIKRWMKEGGILILGYDLFRAMLENKGNPPPFDEYQVALLEKWLLRGPNIVIADEAHILRGQKSQISKLCARFSTKRRIALTGSPLSNSLKEYFCMFDWISPGGLGNIEWFDEHFIKPIEAGSDMYSSPEEQRKSFFKLSVLNQLLGPKIDRADLSVLKSQLPPKYEFQMMLRPTRFQRAAYNIVVGAVRSGSAGTRTAHIWSWLHILQLCCNHPSLLKEKLQQDLNGTAPEHQYNDHTSKIPHQNPERAMAEQLFPKIDMLLNQVADRHDTDISTRVTILMAIIEESVKVGDKVLVFLQTIPTIHYLERTFNDSNIPFCTMTGDLQIGKRQELVKKFNSPGPESVFLISTRAGGLGLNIQGANRVVIFDFSFNPMWEKQAIGRAYRIGQTKPVFVYRFISAGTFEEKMHKKTLFKNEIATRVIDNTQVQREGTNDISTYLVNCENTPRVDKVNEQACLYDPVVMPVLQNPANLRFFNEIKIVEERHEEEILTADEQSSVDDEVRLLRLRFTDPKGYDSEMNKRASV